MTRGRLCALVVRRRRLVIAGWLALGAALWPLARRAEHDLEVSSRIPGSPSAEVEQILATRFESPFARSLLLVVRGVPSPDTSVGREALEQVVAGLGRIPEAGRSLSYLDSGDALFLPATYEPGTFVVVGLRAGGAADPDLLSRLRRGSGEIERHLRVRFPGATLRFTGEPALNFDLRRATAEEVRAGERRAGPATLALLLLAFGAPLAALLPIASGALATVLALGAAVALDRATPLSASLQSVVSMLGLGLGIDYALLTLARFREARGEGCSSEEAARQAAHQAGHTVVLSGAAVALGFVGLLLVPLRELRSVAVGGLLVVAASVLLATTLLPALLAGLGRLVEAGRVRLPREGSARRWRRWASWVAAHPVAVLAIAGAPMIALALQAVRLRTDLPRGDWLPPMESARALADLRALGRSGVAQGVRVILELPEVAVFGAFALGDLLLVRILGFALAVAVLLDATLVRLAVGPALLCLAGRWNWWPGRAAVEMAEREPLRKAG